MALRQQIRNAVFSVLDSIDSVTGKRGPMVPPRRLMNGGSNSILRNDFTKIGDELFRYLVQFGEVKPDDRVLDVGCSVGRIAIPLTGYLTTGSYAGFDGIKESVDYCREAITPRHQNFQFIHADIRNAMYNPEGEIEPEDFLFPYSDDSFDFVFLTSIFTHMQRPETLRYLSEIVRVLAPGGRMFATFFLLDAISQKAIACGRADFDFAHPGNGTRVQSAEAQDLAVAFDRQLILTEMAERGLSVRNVLRGSWIGAPSDSGYQDTVIAEKL